MNNADMPQLPVDVVLGQREPDVGRLPVYRTGEQPTVETYMRDMLQRVRALPQTDRTRTAIQAAEMSRQTRDTEQMRYALEELVNLASGAVT